MWPAESFCVARRAFNEVHAAEFINPIKRDNVSGVQVMDVGLMLDMKLTTRVLGDE